VTMVVNLTTTPLAPSSLNKAFIFVFLAPIHPSRSERQGRTCHSVHQ
jgi:hypothetical protein